MRQSVSDSDDSGEPGFQQIVDGFLLQPGLPFATVLTAAKINRIFRKHGGLFGKDDIYSTPIVLWAFLSLAIATVMDVVLGPYKGKETGESALLRQIMTSLMAGDVVVFDRYYCSFMMIALLLNQRVEKTKKGKTKKGQVSFN